jgi:acyl carrier protein
MARMDRAEIGTRVRTILARVIERDPAEVLALPDSTPLFGAGLALDSLTGLELLTAAKSEFGVDIAASDLNLDSLETLGTLADYLALHSDSSHASL